MSCETWSEKLDAYVDGELPESETATLGKHLRQCASCAAGALERVQMKRAVADAGKRYAPSAECRQRIQQAARKPVRRGNVWGWQVVVLPALLILIISLAMSFYV